MVDYEITQENADMVRFHDIEYNVMSKLLKRISNPTIIISKKKLEGLPTLTLNGRLHLMDGEYVTFSVIEYNDTDNRFTTEINSGNFSKTFDLRYFEIINLLDKGEFVK
jgi:hypothetical protein